MSKEAFDRAQQIFKKLQGDDDFEHIGRDSRGIRIQTDSLIEGIAMMSMLYPQDAESLVLMGALIKLASEDYGTYVRVKGGPEWVGIHVRGLTGPMDENTSFEELSKIAMRRSGVLIDVHSDGRSSIGTDSAFLKMGGQEVSVVINELLKMTPDERKEKLADAFVNVLAEGVAISGEFLDF